MRKRSRESLPGIFTPVLTAPILAGIHELNRDYVELLIARQGDEHFAATLPAAVVAGLAALPSTSRAALAACSFALYSLGFEQQDFWRGECAATADMSSERYPLRHALPAASCFAINASFYAWHVTNVQRVAARMFYAMPDAAIDGLMRTSLVDLQRIACATSGLLSPRWSAMFFHTAYDAARTSTTISPIESSAR